ncbi:MAG: hypothetical protein GX027_05145 [Clostridiaceae bacterium]|jgi:ribonuclease HI|nr:hypothetical protein [Clostridiaceae bacterium]
MPYICENELMEIYQRLAPVLAEHGFSCDIAMIRDYMLKVYIDEGDERLGKLIVNYSPRKNSFSFRRDSDLSQEHFDRVSSILADRLGADPDAKKPGENESHPRLMMRKPALEIDFSALPARYQSFVDGSFIQGRIGYGAVILDRGKPVAELCGSVDDPDALPSRQVGGEIRAVVETLEWCKGHGITEICIFHDFENVEKWAVGSYKTNMPMTREYKQYIDSCGIKIFWYKVESHTGVGFNERADELAKMGACGLSP